MAFSQKKARTSTAQRCQTPVLVIKKAMPAVGGCGGCEGCEGCLAKCPSISHYKPKDHCNNHDDAVDDEEDFCLPGGTKKTTRNNERRREEKEESEENTRQNTHKRTFLIINASVLRGGAERERERV